MRQMMNERLPISKSLPLRARFYDYPHFTYPWHFHSEYEIIYIKEGAGTRFVGDNVDKYNAGDLVLIGSNLPHYMKSDEIYHSGDSTLRVKGTIIQFEKDFMYHAINHYPHFVKIKRMLDESHRGIYFPANSSSKLNELLSAIPLLTGVDQITGFLQLLKEMSETDARQIISSADYTEDNMMYDTSRIDKVISYLNKNYNRPIHLEEVSSFAAMNPTAFCRFFKNKTGKSLKNYVLDMRIGYACKLLLMDNMNISQISVECGFDTISHFNKVFKKNTGYTPSQYKSLMLKE
ncbi:AraC family transcriptional regulator [Bacteroides sp. 51]|uniref:AraC family transcriptional regulator n=1 Tax=Bacteroides sp. 51 TaxID=2302938 RepID=UPI0013CFE910|nr:AraC family transcriptional regulator [Bacteroides sp. 51]NDV81810.1 AraC family transcriptional regulator [Bacteroides sp. 51]